MEKESSMKEEQNNGKNYYNMPQTQKKNLFATSEKEAAKCPFGLCDGSGIIAYRGTFDTRICDCMQLQIAKTRMKFAEIPNEFRELKINDFRTDCYKTEIGQKLAYMAKKLAIEYIKKFDSIKESGKGFYFYSQTKGSGKTRLMASIGNALIKRHFKSVRFLTTNNLLDEIKNTFQTEGYSRLMEQIKRVDILMLDDFGGERPTDWVNEVFYSILNDRMTAKKITFFTSNAEAEALQYGERIISRVMKMAMPVKFPEESIREAMAKKENESLMTLLMGQ